MRRKLLFWNSLYNYYVSLVSGTMPLSLPKAKAKPVKELIAFGDTIQGVPHGYTLLNYVTMGAGSYLVTNIIPKSDYRIEMEFSTSAIYSGAVTYLCSGGTLRFAHVTAKTWRINGYSQVYDPGDTVTNSTRYTLVHDNKTITVSSEGTTLFTNTFTGTRDFEDPLCINAYNYAGKISQNNEKIRVYSFRVWDGQGKLIANYLPELQGTTAGFYDTVSKKHFFATSGTFAAGTERTTNPTEPVSITCNNGTIKARHQSGLPLGYTLLNYVVFDSTQMINTGFTPNNNTRIESKCRRTGALCWFYGAGNVNPRVTLFLSETGISRWGEQARRNFDFTENTTYTLVQDKNGLSINGVLYPWNEGTAGDFTPTGVLNIGSPDAASPTRFFAGNFYYMKVYDNGTLIRDFVPCKNASNVAGLYDVVNGVFYTDTGLVAGTAVSDPVEIYADDEIETIGIRTQNLFDKDNATILNLSGTGNDPLAYRADRFGIYIPVEPNTVYTISRTGTMYLNLFETAFVPEAGIATTQYTAMGTASTQTITTAATTRYLYIFGDATSFISSLQIEKGAVATDYTPYYLETVTAETLLKVGTYQDSQNIINGSITRNVGVKVLDGTETWGTMSNKRGYYTMVSEVAGVPYNNNITGYCTHFQYQYWSPQTSNTHIDTNCFAYNGSTNTNGNITFRPDLTVYDTVEKWQQWLADQYAAGTPVIVLYPLAESTTESTSSQTISTAQGNNIVEIEQAGIADLDVSIKYYRGK